MSEKNVAVFQMPLLSEQDVMRGRARGRVLALLVMLVQVLVCYAVKDFAFVTEVSIFFAIVMTVMLAITVIIPLWQQADYQWLSQCKCGALADACEREPGLQAYRDAVCAMGRRFTNLEAKNMRCWAIKQAVARAEANRESEATAACKRLYSVAGH